MLDTGLVWDGYFCDFDRNFAVGSAEEKTRTGYRRLIDAVQAGLETAKPGATASDVLNPAPVASPERNQCWKCWVPRSPAA